MSYSIEYDRQFIKSELGITPCALFGSNNVWEGSGRSQRRARSWQVFLKKLGTTEQELIDAVSDSLGGSQEHWRKNGKWVDDEGLLRWIHNGCMSAASIEDILQVNHLKSISCHLSVWPKDGWNDRSELKASVSTTEEFDAWVNEARDKIAEYKASGDTKAVFPIIQLAYDTPILHPSTKKLDPHARVLLKHPSYGYIKSIISHPFGGDSCSYTPRPSEAQEFSAEAADVLMRLHQLSKVKMVSAKVKETYMPSVVQFSNGTFIYKKTAAKLYFTTSLSSAKVYANEAAAERAMLNPAIQAYCRKKGITSSVSPLPTK